MCNLRSWERYGHTPPAPGLAKPVDQIDRILIEKSARRLTAFKNGVAILSYDTALGFTPEGDKQIEGDGKTPEGVYHINRRNPESAYHLSLGIDYPQPEDVARAVTNGTNPGGDIFIHGQPNGIGAMLSLPGDWTAGCIAVSDSQIRELWRITDIGTEVEIAP
ncbi:MAG: L,D-transpeptidase family protein [Rhodobacteraceae bacterium]|nr:L,D-transpeptidase family protein [Paracoccaceae bacterium]